MNRWRVSFLLAATVMLGGLQGCGCPNKHRAGYQTTPRPAVAPPCERCTEGGPLPPRFNPNPPPGPPGPPPAALPSSPPSIPNSPPAIPGSPPAIPSPPSASAVPPPPAGDIQQHSYPPPGPSNPPAPPTGAPNVYLQAPEPVGGEPARPMPNEPAPRDETRRYTPQTPEPPAAPPAKDKDTASPALPVDIPQFAAVKPNVANGQEPFAEGVNWLKARGYRAVLHLRAPGADDREARRPFEQNGLRYLSLEVSPQTLSKDIVDQFDRLVADPSNLPLFVYDKDSSLAGGLWYLYFRLVDKESDEKARADAAHLGFRHNDEGPHKAMWLAVQNYLATIKRD